MFFDPHSATTRVFLAKLEDMVEQKRKALEKPTRDHDETQYVRGQIKGIRMVVALIESDNEELTDEPTG